MTTIEHSSPARLYALLVGATLALVGVIGFFYSSSFGSPGETDKIFGMFTVNGWHNVMHLVSGALGLLAAGYAARQYALGMGLIYLAIAVWGFVIGNDAILGFIPVNTEDGILHLVIGATGIGAFLATPAAPGKRKRTSPPLSSSETAGP